jgi:hypothetical protein
MIVLWCHMIFRIGMLCHMIVLLCHMVDLLCHMVDLLCHMVDLLCHMILIVLTCSFTFCIYFVDVSYIYHVYCYYFYLVNADILLGILFDKKLKLFEYAYNGEA